MKPTLFRITVKAYKEFYVEATSEDDALTLPTAENESAPAWRGSFEWEHDETLVRKCSADEVNWIRDRHPESIAREQS